MLKMLNMAQIRCPVGFCEEMIAVFWMINDSNQHRNWQKTKHFPNLIVF